MIKIQPSGDYVQLIYVDPVQESVQQELRSDTDAFEVSYDSDGKLFMQFGAMRFENPNPTDFEVDGSPVTDAADFISKLNALFTGGGGGGGLQLESYENSAMSSAVMAYVFRSGEDIYRVYEPIRNNDVSRSQFAYEDSIDQFPFDDTDCFNNIIVDLSLVSMVGVISIKSKNSFIRNVQFQFFNGILILQDCILINSIDDSLPITFGVGTLTLNQVVTSGFFVMTSILGDFTLKSIQMEMGAGILGDGTPRTVSITNAKLGVQSDILTKADGTLSEIFLGSDANYHVGGNGTNISIGNFSTLDASAVSDSLSGISLGDNCTVTGIDATITGKTYQGINGTTYELGVTTGNVTATEI